MNVIQGTITTHLTYDQARMISDIASALDMSVEDLTLSLLQDVIDAVMTPDDELTGAQAVFIDNLNDKTDNKPISFLQYLRELEINPELLWIDMDVWAKEQGYGDDKPIDMMKLINNHPDMPYLGLWTDFIAMRKDANMLPISWQEEFKLIRKWVIDKKNLLGEITYI